ncbi:hypothetical protein [Sediminibacterium soli]|uniref:hypothetical protein n=1 Tax=Sediminibacterium soli TaxID=2698829 RepID=UPI00137AE41C|nr:hypothetical protein [Sediminibacterium soli]NCI48058.1 hypothetical protein [Sediminibacterium soli]
MNTASTNHPLLPEDESFSIKKELQSLAVTTRSILIERWRLLAVVACLGIVGGLLFYWIKPVSYTSRTTFIVEESKGAGSLASLAGQFGFDLGSLGSSSTSGLLGGDNVMELVKSHSLIRKTLLTSYDSAAPAVSIADKYAELMKWKTKWAKSGKIGRTINFTAGSQSLDRTTDSLLQKMIARIIQSDIDISKPDKKLGFFALNVTMRDERASLLFSRRLLKAAADLYIETKTKRIVNNVNRLQAKADSLERNLNRKTYSAATTDRLLLDANPAYAAPEASAEISSRDKYMQATIYAEIVKNLEISKTALMQETPTIQVVDSPEIPLKDNKVDWWIFAISGLLLADFAALILLMIMRKAS